MSDFEQEIEQELHRVLDPMLAGSIPVRSAPQAGGVMKRRILGGAGAALAAKVAVGFAVAAFAAAAVATVTEVTTTGSLNPSDVGNGMSSQVAACKATLRASGVRGIGECVSDLAQHHGQLNSNHASGAREHGNGNGNGTGQGQDKDKGKGKDKH
jgi:hypothetical protein